MADAEPGAHALSVQHVVSASGPFTVLARAAMITHTLWLQKPARTVVSLPQAPRDWCYAGGCPPSCFCLNSARGCIGKVALSLQAVDELVESYAAGVETLLAVALDSRRLASAGGRPCSDAVLQ